jgi:hypothetical protein
MEFNVCPIDGRKLWYMAVSTKYLYWIITGHVHSVYTRFGAHTASNLMSIWAFPPGVK